MAGLSPLTRGNLDRWTGHTPPPGPIPAHAGEPGAPGGSLRAAWAYPRSRGGTAAWDVAADDGMGLSPLTRGNLTQRIAREKSIGPIPAHAGEPLPVLVLARSAAAYPRSRGGTASARLMPARVMGLSPLTRGNLAVHGCCSLRWGPIPAHAGEPSRPAAPRWVSRAYPRSRGGTDYAKKAGRLSMGLSPLTRGNRLGR